MFTKLRQGKCRFGVVMAITTWLLGGCSLQNDYATPSVTQPREWTVPAESQAQEVAPYWWAALHDPAIDRMVKATYLHNPTLDQAIAAIDEARAQVGIRRADYFPVLSVNGNISKANTEVTSGGGNGGVGAAGTQGIIIGNNRTSQIGPSLSWELDLFGRIRSSVEASQRRLDARTADAESTKLSLAVQVANTVLDWRACTHTVQVNENEILSRKKTLELIRQKITAGFTPQVDAASVERDMAAVESSMAAQQEACMRDVNALVELTGQPHDTVRADLALPLKATTVPAGSIAAFMPSAPVATPKLPASVLLNHPSVIAADRDAAAAWAEIGVARADRLPRIDLSAALNYQWITVAGSTIGLTTWSLGPGIAATLFDGGKGAANIEASQARYRQAVANLEATVRATVKEVENALAAQQSAATRLASSQRAANAAQYAFSATQAQWDMGIASLLELEDARRQQATAQDNLILAARDQATAWVGLVNATANSLTLTQSQLHAADPVPPS